MLFSVEGIRQLFLVSDSAEDSFFAKVTALDPVPGFAENVLPALFAAFSQAVRKNRAALFAETSTAAEARGTATVDASVSFFCSCTSYIAQRCDGVAQWMAYTRLVEALRSTNQYSRSSQWHAELTSLAIKAATAVDGEATSAALSLLSTLLKLDYELISDVCPDVLKVVARVSPFRVPCVPV